MVSAERHRSAQRYAPAAVILLAGVAAVGTYAAHSGDQEQTATCAIESFSYDTSRDTLELGIAIGGIALHDSQQAHPVKYTATTTTTEDLPLRILGSRFMTGVVENGIASVDYADVPKKPSDHYRVALRVRTGDAASIDCGSQDFEFTQENGELTAVQSGQTVVCDRSRGDLVLVRPEDVNTKYTRDFLACDQ